MERLGKFEHNRYVGDKRTQVVYDIDELGPEHEAVIISTCNRVEFYAAASDPQAELAPPALTHFLTDFHNVPFEEAQQELTANILVPTELPQRPWDLVLIADLLAADNKTVTSSIAAPVRTLSPTAPFKVELTSAPAAEGKAGAGETGKLVGKIFALDLVHADHGTVRAAFGKKPALGGEIAAHAAVPVEVIG
mgnify:CR=1 FL=1